MRVRTFGFLLLLLAGVVPLAVFGFFAVDRSRATAIAEVREGNDAFAQAVAGRVEAYIESEERLLATAGAAIAQARDARAAGLQIEAFDLDHSHITSVSVFDQKLEPWAGAEPSALQRELAARALAGEPARSKVRESDRSVGFTMTFAQPIVVAGQRRGVIAADVDLVGLWPPVNAVKIGTTGFVRLLDGDGRLLAHGDPEERRYVFAPDREKDRRLVAAARRGEIALNQSGERVVASVADVPDTDWVVVVEQSEAEAFAGAAALTRDLVVVAAIALVVLAGIGIFMGRRIVRPLERLRSHTRVIGGGDLDARIDPRTALVEVRSLGESLNEMSASLQQLQEEARARERLTTFARIAAGLAHDLRIPIESVRTAVDAFLSAGGDDNAMHLLETVNRRDLPRLKEFVEDLRMLSRRGVEDLETEELAPGELADELAEELGTYAKWRGIVFRAEGRGAPVAANRKLVRRAIFNLASNAADACLEQGPGGEVTILVTDRGGEGVAFAVRDTGPGIPPDRLEGLLTGDFASTKRSSGIGLGLGVARHVAGVHGGELGVESEVGVGTTFTLTVPRGRVAPSASSELKGMSHGEQNAHTHAG